MAIVPSPKWSEVSGLRASGQKFTDMSQDKMPRLVRYRSNFETIATAKGIFGEGIRQLREKRQKSLAEVHAYIDEIEAKLKQLDFSVLSESKEAVTETVYQQIISAPDVEVVQPGGNRYRVTPPVRPSVRHGIA